MLQCPSCQSSMRLAPSQLNADEYCGECGGVWITAQKLSLTQSAWGLEARFIEDGPSADFCPECGPVPLDVGTLLGETGLSCSQCQGVFMRRPLKPPRGLSSARSLRSREQPQSRPRIAVGHTEDEGVRREAESHESNSPRRLTPRLTHIASPRVSAPSKTSAVKKQRLKTTPQTQPQRSNVIKWVAVGVRDLIWFGGLLIAIITSLLYWMSP